MIIDFEKINAVKDAFTAKWDAYFHDYDRKADPTRDDKASGFFKVQQKKIKKKSKMKIYLDDGDGVFSKNNDVLLTTHKLDDDWDERDEIGGYSKGDFYIEYSHQTYMRKGKTKLVQDFTATIDTEAGFIMAEINSNIGVDIFADYLYSPCETNEV